MDVNVVVLNVDLNIAFLTLICTTVANETSPSLLTDVSEGWSLPPSVLLTGAWCLQASLLSVPLLGGGYTVIVLTLEGLTKVSHHL